MGNWCGKKQRKLSDEREEQHNPIRSRYEFNFEGMVQFKKSPINLDYKIEELKGKGASAEVYRAVSISGGFETAIKKIRRRANNEKLANEFINEFSILKSLDHPNILKVYDIYEEQDNFYIVTELCTGGELFDQIMIRKTFTELSASLLFYQILQAVRYLHQNNIMHRDIKPQNLLLSNNSTNAYLKLIDFGSACKFQDSEPIPRRRVGTSYYVAPEVLLRHYNQKCDVWSCGVILFILLSGEPPFKGKDDKEVLAAIEVGKYSFHKEAWRYVGSQAKDLISRMLEYDPKKRCTIKEAMSHPWLEIRFKSAQYSSLVGANDLRHCLQNMRNFCKLKKIQEGILMFITNFLTTSQEKDHLMYCFKMLDLDGDGSIRRQELKKAYSKYLGGSDKEIDTEVTTILSFVDKNKSGSVSFSEFIMSAIKIEQCLTQDKIDRAFKLLDRDGSGTLSIQELKNMLGQNIPTDYFTQIVKEFDLNSDGEISRQEFADMMRKVSFLGF